jgi:hypothetical protein
MYFVAASTYFTRAAASHFETKPRRPVFAHLQKCHGNTIFMNFQAEVNFANLSRGWIHFVAYG